MSNVSVARSTRSTRRVSKRLTRRCLHVTCGGGGKKESTYCTDKKTVKEIKDESRAHGAAAHVDTDVFKILDVRGR